MKLSTPFFLNCKLSLTRGIEMLLTFLNPASVTFFKKLVLVTHPHHVSFTNMMVLPHI